MNYTLADLAKMIDHSLLNPVLTIEELEAGLATALRFNAASVCAVPWFVPRAAEVLEGSSVIVGTTVGFPHGAQSRKQKRMEARESLAMGAEELDMVVNISRVLSGDWKAVDREIRCLCDDIHEGGGKIKVIFENCYLEEKQIIRLCGICTEAGADWVKTSTGYGTGGAENGDLRLMRLHSGPKVQIKAAGGVRTLDRLLEVRSLGCSRAGATATEAILVEAEKRLGL